jgi:hypothetical protein
MNTFLKIKYVLVVLLFVCVQTQMKAQRMAITTNLLSDVALAPNFGVDVVIADKQSLAIDVTCAPYKISEKLHNKQMALTASYKFWLTQALYAHYISVDGVLCSSDLQIGSLGSRDEYVGLGIGYGYSFIIGKKINIVPNIGVGVAYGKNYQGTDHMVKPNVGVQAEEKVGILPVLTRFGVTFQYVLR